MEVIELQKFQPQHPRNTVVASARQDLENDLWKVQQRYDLTSNEFLLLLSEIQVALGTLFVRIERENVPGD